METERNKKIKASILNSYVLITILLLIYIIIRVFTVDMTHDEGVSYEIIRFKRGLFSTSNNQWGNSIPEMILTALFGYSQFILRTTNIIGFIIYGYFVYKICQRYSETVWSLILALPIFLLNPFLIEFFGLSRGYGIAAALFTGSIYWALHYKGDRHHSAPVIYSIFFAVASIYCNFSFVTAILSLHVSVFLYFIIKKQLTVLAAAKYCIIEFALLIPAFIHIVYLKMHGELYYAGKRNIIQDTFCSLIENMVPAGIRLGIIYMLIGAIFFIALMVLFNRKNVLHTIITIIFFSLLIIPTILFYTAGFGYPLDRTALYWVPVWGIMVLSAMDTVGSRPTLKKYLTIGVITFLSIASVINFSLQMNFNQVRFWKEDHRTREILAFLRQHKQTPNIQLGVTWYYFPSFNYYQQQQCTAWLDSIICYDTNRVYDYYLAPPDDSIKVPIKNALPLQNFRDIGAVLYKNNDTQKN